VVQKWYIENYFQCLCVGVVLTTPTKTLILGLLTLSIPPPAALWYFVTSPCSFAKPLFDSLWLYPQAVPKSSELLSRDYSSLRVATSWISVNLLLSFYRLNFRPHKCDARYYPGRAANAWSLIRYSRKAFDMRKELFKTQYLLCHAAFSLMSHILA